ncbi:unnamed protein product [Heligmosomoides polygyrus]|uniref:Flagellar FliJ protein n=1 Tax=Heligmosomoides polygyrus TaxID=6339 RepID=A0A183FMA9_HELPZ|nr:unnamed protein product [Heligmosomoides polygyrus]
MGDKVYKSSASSNTVYKPGDWSQGSFCLYRQQCPCRDVIVLNHANRRRLSEGGAAHDGREPTSGSSCREDLDNNRRCSGVSSRVYADDHSDAADRPGGGAAADDGRERTVAAENQGTSTTTRDVAACQQERAQTTRAVAQTGKSSTSTPDPGAGQQQMTDDSNKTRRSQTMKEVDPQKPPGETKYDLWQDFCSRGAAVFQQTQEKLSKLAKKDERRGAAMKVSNRAVLNEINELFRRMSAFKAEVIQRLEEVEKKQQDEEDRRRDRSPNRIHKLKVEKYRLLDKEHDVKEKEQRLKIALGEWTKRFKRKSLPSEEPSQQ